MSQYYLTWNSQEPSLLGVPSKGGGVGTLILVAAIEKGLLGAGLLPDEAATAAAVAVA